MARGIPTGVVGPPATFHLRAHREARGMTRVGLASAAGVTRMTIHRLETGIGQGIDFRVLGALAHALGLAPGALFAPPEIPKAAKAEKPKAAAKRRR